MYGVLMACHTEDEGLLLWRRKEKLIMTLMIGLVQHGEHAILCLSP